MQLRLPIETTHPITTPIDPASLVQGGNFDTELDRLRRELASSKYEEAKHQRRRDKCNRNIRKQRERQASLALQLESLERNPLAIGRYRSTVPQDTVSTHWYDKPLSELKLETLNGIGTKRLKLLYDRCPTIGDLEVFRVYEGLTKIPGLRRISVARIERKLFAWLRNNAWDYEPMPSWECSGAGRVSNEMPKVIL